MKSFIFSISLIMLSTFAWAQENQSCSIPLSAKYKGKATKITDAGGIRLERPCFVSIQQKRTLLGQRYYKILVKSENLSSSYTIYNKKLNKKYCDDLDQYGNSSIDDKTKHFKLSPWGVKQTELDIWIDNGKFDFIEIKYVEGGIYTLHRDGIMCEEMVKIK